VWWTVLRPGGAGTGKDDDETKSANHDAFPSSKRRDKARWPVDIRRNGAILRLGTELAGVNSWNAVSVPLKVQLETLRVVCTHASQFAIEYA